MNTIATPAQIDLRERLVPGSNDQPADASGSVTAAATATAGPSRGPGSDHSDDPTATASPPVQAMWAAIKSSTQADLPPMGLEAGLGPATDVDLLLRCFGAAEYELARRMDAASRAGALPLKGDGAMALGRRWSRGSARRLARVGAFARRFPDIAGPWAAGVITAEHVDVLAKAQELLSEEEMAAVLDQLVDRWGRHNPADLTKFVADVVRTLHPPPDPEPDEVDAYGGRSLSFSILGDTVLLAGSFPRLEGEALMASVESFAERLRTTADDVPAAARRADGLIALVNAAAASGTLPSRGGLPVSLFVTLEHTSAGDPVWSTSRGHRLTGAEERFVACCSEKNPVVVSSAALAEGAPGSSTAARIAALARTLLDECLPLAVGRTHRGPTAAQRRALAVRDTGCIMPGCGVPADACQTHHVTEWAAGGPTDVANLALVCWAHHRQVDLGMWQITPARISPPDSGDLRWPADHGAPWTISARPRSRWSTTAKP